MIHSVFELGDTLVREVMVPRPDVVWVERDTAVDKVLRLALRSGYSRLPVLGENIDDVIGVAYLKDLVRAQAERARTPSLDRRHAARGVRPRQQADRRAAQGDAAHPQPHGDRRRRVRRHRRRRHDRGHPRGDRRGDHRRVRRARSCPTSPGSTTVGCGSPRGCPSKTCRSSTACSRRAASSTRARRAQLRAVLEEADVDTVGGLLAQQLGRVPLPGAEVEVAGLHLLAEGGKDARGRVRITTVLVTPVPRRRRRRPTTEPNGPSGASDAPNAALARPRRPRRTGARPHARETTPPAPAPAGGRRTMSGAAELDPEDAKIVTLARRPGRAPAPPRGRPSATPTAAPTSPRPSRCPRCR